MMPLFEEWRQCVKNKLLNQPNRTICHYTTFWDAFIVPLPIEICIVYFRVKQKGIKEDYA